MEKKKTKKELEKEIEELELTLKAEKLKKELKALNDDVPKKSMAWFNFYLYWLPWLMILFSFNNFNNLEGLEISLGTFTANKYYIYLICALIINLSLVAFRLLTAYYVKNKKPEAPFFLKAILYLQIIIPIVDLILFLTIISNYIPMELNQISIQTLVMGIVSGIIMYIVNSIYFNKRLFAFDHHEGFKF